MDNIRVLIIDDDENIVKSISMMIKLKGMTALTAAPDDVDTIFKEEFDVLLLDIYLGNRNGIEILEKVIEQDPFLPVIMISGLAGVDEAIEAVKKGAFDFIEKPLKPERLVVSIRNAAKFRQIKQDGIKDYIPVYASAIMDGLVQKMKRVALANTNVLIFGESGTGKDICARFIHHCSRRREEAFVKLNCGAIPESLIESELFGHKKGSFTGAVSDYSGKIQTAHGGTLFLDEIGELSLASQVKLLRFLESGEIQRIGDTKNLEVDVRVLAATNRNLEEQVSLGHFREDLFYRLNIIPFEIPPLRERPEDIPLLVHSFSRQMAAEMGIPDPYFSENVMDKLKNYSFKGNVRELKAVVERLLVLSGGTIQEQDIDDAILSGSKKGAGTSIFKKTMLLSEAKKQLELRYIEEQLALHGGSIQNTADALGLLANNLSRRIKQLRNTAE